MSAKSEKHNLNTAATTTPRYTVGISSQGGGGFVELEVT
jgi:hypothetical protein